MAVLVTVKTLAVSDHVEFDIGRGRLLTPKPVVQESDLTLGAEIEMLDAASNGNRVMHQPAAAYIEFHMVGHCKRFDCDEDGNACGFVCAGHLDALEHTAECTVRELRPAPPVRWLSRRIGRCTTCDRSILFVSDVLQVVVML
nr:hypothetical protein [Mycobacterium sp. E1386]